LKDNKAEEMKVRSERYENKTYRTNISRDKTVYHHKKQTNVDSYKKETHLSEVIGNSAKLKTLTSLILDAENNEEKVKERNSVLIDKKVDHQNAEMKENMQGNSNKKVNHQNAEMKENMQGNSNILKDKKAKT